MNKKFMNRNYHHLLGIFFRFYVICLIDSLYKFLLFFWYFFHFFFGLFYFYYSIVFFLTIIVFFVAEILFHFIFLLFHCYTIANLFINNLYLLSNLHKCLFSNAGLFFCSIGLVYPISGLAINLYLLDNADRLV